MPSIYLPPFDPGRNFKCQAFFRAGGIIWSRGQEFDKTCVNERVLRQLYDMRRIGYSEDQQVRQIPLPKPAKKIDVSQKDHGPLDDDKDKKPEPLDHDGDGEKGGVKDPTPLSDDEKAALLMGAKTKKELLEMAAAIPEIKAINSKAEIAAAIVKAGNVAA